MKGLAVFLFSIFAMLLAGATFAVDFVEREEDIPDGKIFAFINGGDSYSLWIREDEKKYLEKITRKAKEVVYREAAVHNPEGDMLPDNVDNDISNELKSRIN